MASDPQNPFLDLGSSGGGERQRPSRRQGDNPFAGLGGGTATAEAEPAAEPAEASEGGEGPGLLSRAWSAVRESVGDLLERDTEPEFPYAPEGYTPPMREEPLPEPGSYPAVPHETDPHDVRRQEPEPEPGPERLRGSELATALEEHTEGRARGPVHDLTPEEQAQAQVAQTRYQRGTEREAEAQEAREYAAGRTPGERLVNAGSSFMQSAVGMGASSLQGLASLAKDLDELTGTGEYEGQEASELQLAQWGQRLQDWAEETFPDDPEMRGAFLENVLPSAVGSAATFLALGAGGRAAGAPGYVTAGTAGALAEAGGQYEEAEAAGAPESERRLAARLALPLGALEALPVERQLGRLFSGGGSLSRVTREALIGGLEEGFQEGVQGTGGNIIAGELYDPDRLAFEGVPESMLAGMLTGGGLSAGATGAGNLMADPTDTYVSYHRELERKYGENLWGMTDAEARRLGRLAGRVAAREGEGELEDVEARPRESIPGVHTPERGEVGDPEATGRPMDRFGDQGAEPQAEEDERIVAAAVRGADGKLYRGVEHGEARAKAEEAGTEVAAHDLFETNTERVIGRREAQEEFGTSTAEEAIPGATEAVRERLPHTDPERERAAPDDSGFGELGEEFDAEQAQEAQEGAQEFPGGPEGPAVEPVARGRQERTLFPGTGERVETEYVLVPLEELVPSHDPFSFTRQPEDVFAPQRQQRAYHGTRGQAAREDVQRKADQYDVELALEPSLSADAGVPTVTPNLRAVAGNQRVMMLQRIARDRPEVYEAYLDQLRSQAEQFGIDPDQVEPGMAVVRRVTDPEVDVTDVETLRELNAASDVARGKTKDVLSEAGTRAEQLVQSGRALQHFSDTVGEETIRSYLGTGAGRTFLQELMADGVITEGDRARFIDAKTGTPTQEGKLLVERIMRSAAVGDPDVVSRAPASALRKLDSALPAIIQANQVEGWSISPVLADALDVLASARANDNTVLDQLAQGSILEGDQVSDEVASMARFLDAAKKNDVTEMFREYAENAEAYRRMKQSEDLFGHEPTTPEEARSRFDPATVAMAPGVQLREGPVRAAAVRIDGEVYEGTSHINAIVNAADELGVDLDDEAQFDAMISDITREDRGFVDQDGNWLTREEARDVAMDARQANTATTGRRLMSEDIRALEPEEGFAPRRDEPPIRIDKTDGFKVIPQTELGRELEGAQEAEDADRFLELVYRDPFVEDAEENSVQPGDLEDTWNRNNVALQRWLERMRSSGARITREELEEKAEELADRGWETTPERERQREAWLARLDRNNGWASEEEVREDGYAGEVARERQAVLVLGPPAAGKSTVANPILKRYRAKLIDSDEMKQLIPEFDGGKNAGGVHEESSELTKKLNARAVARGENIVVPMVGKTLSSLQEDIQTLKDEGYDVHLVINELPSAKAAWRAYVRFHDQDRYVSFNYIIGAVRNRPQANFQVVKDDPRVSTYQRFNNDVPFGTKPVLLERSEDAPELPGLPHEVDAGGAEEAGEVGPEAVRGDVRQGAREGQEGRFRSRGAEGEVAPLEPGQPADQAEVQDNLFGGSELVGGQEQTSMGLEGGRTLAENEDEARQTISLLEGRIRRGVASNAEQQMYDQARALLRRGDKLDAEEVARQARETPEEDRRPQYGDTGELFGLMPEPSAGELTADRGLRDRLEAELRRMEEQRPGLGRWAAESWQRAHGTMVANLREAADAPPGTGEGALAAQGAMDVWWNLPPFMQARYLDALELVQGRHGRDNALEDLAIRRRQLEGEGSPLEKGWSEAELASENLRDTGRFRTATEEETGRFLSRETDEAVPSRAEIQQEIEEAFGLPVKTGGLGRRFAKALGIYKARPESVHLATHGDIVTLAHEVGHHVQKLFFESPDGRIYEDHLAMLPQDIQEELQELGRGVSGGGLREGWAEFWRRYVDNPAALPRRAPNLLAYVQERLDSEFPHIRDALEHGARQWRLHREGSELARVESQISVNERGPRRSAKESWSAIRTGLLDRFEPIREAVEQLTDGRPVVGEDAEMLARLAGGSSGIAEHFLEHGQIDYATQEVIGPSLREVIEPVATNLDNFRTYAVSRRAQELHDRDIETGIRPEDADAVVARMEEHFGDSFRPTFEALVEYQDTLLRYLVDAGVMSEQTYTAIKEKNRAYVPFMRVMEQQGASGISGAFGHLFSPVKKIQGSGRQIVDPLESIVKATYQYTQLAAKQEVSQALARLAERQGAATQLEAVETPIRRVQFKLGEIEDQLGQAIGYEALDEIRELAEASFAEATAGMSEEEVRAAGIKPYDPAEELMAIFRPGDLFNKANVISVLEDGKRRYYEVNEELWEALQGIGTEHAPLVARWLGIPARTLRAGATLAPEFQLRNPIRDQTMAAIQSEYGYTPYVDLAKGMFHILGRTDLYKKWKLSGGERASLLALDRREMQRNVEQLTRSGGVENVIKTELDALRLFGQATAELVKLNLRGAAETSIEAVQAAVDPLARVSALMEDATRVGEFANALEVEGDTKEGRQLAGSASREISIDFARHGSKTAAIRVMAAFWNARLQGYDRLARAIKNNPAKFAGKTFTYITLPSLIELAVNWDDEEYWEQPQWQRDLFWMFKVGGVWWRIPKPFELGLVFGTVPQRIAEWIFREDPTGVEKFLSETAPKELEGFVPAPTALMPLVENTVNYSFFLDRPIVPRSEEGVEPRFQYNERTSEVARAIGQWTGSSPRKIDNLLYAWSGGLGRMATGSVDKLLEATGARVPTEAEGIPGVPGIRGVTARDPGFSSESIERFYQRRGEATEALETSRFLRREHRGEELDEFLSDPENRRRIRQVHIPGPAKGIFERTAGQLTDLRARAERIRRDEDLTPAEKKERIDELGLQARELARRALERSSQ